MPPDIFPETEVPTLDEIREAREGLFEEVSFEGRAEDYVQTLRAWFAGMRRNEQTIVDTYSREVFDRYVRLVVGGQAQFRQGLYDLTRTAFVKI